GCDMGKRGNHLTDKVVRQIRESLAQYESSHPEADIQVRRQNSVSVRLRIIDPDFQGMDRVDRDSLVWRSLEKLPEQTQSQVTMVLLLTPEEAKTSFANLDFEHPVSSQL